VLRRLEHRLIVPFLSLLFWLYALPASAAEDPSSFNALLKKLAEHVYAYIGKGGHWANAGFIITREGVVVIDTGQTPDDSRRILAEISRLTSQPLRYLINTQPHPDHHLGNFVFSPPAIGIAHINTLKHIRNMDIPKMLDLFVRLFPEAADSLKGYRPAPPTIGFSERMSLFIGGTEIQLIHYPNAHTDGDVAVWLPEGKILFAGGGVNLRRHLNVSDGSSQGVLEAIDRLRKLEPLVIVPAHGVLGRAEDFEVLRTYILTLRARVKALMDQGKSVEEVKKELRMPEYEAWPGKEWLPRSAERIYNELQGR